MDPKTSLGMHTTASAVACPNEIQLSHIESMLSRSASAWQSSAVLCATFSCDAEGSRCVPCDIGSSLFFFAKAQSAALLDMEGAGRGKRARMPKKRNKQEAEPSSTDWLDLTGESDEEIPTIQRKRAKQSRAAAKSKSPAHQRVDWQVSIAG